jgi:hypothetical protein
VLDLVGGRAMEMQYLFEEPLMRARLLQQEDPSLHFASLEAVLLMCQGIGALSEKKKARGEAWTPTYFSE